MSDNTRLITSKAASLAASLACASHHPAYQLLNIWQIQLVDTPDTRDSTCGICQDDVDRMIPPVIYLKHRACRRTCHAACLLDYLASENSCLCPYCRACMKDHDTPDQCVLWEERVRLWEQAQVLRHTLNSVDESEEFRTSSESEDESRTFQAGLEENILTLRSDEEIARLSIDSVDWLCEHLHFDRDYSRDYRGPADRVFNEINELSTVRHRRRRHRGIEKPIEVHQLSAACRESRAAWLWDWNAFINQLQVLAPDTVNLNTGALYEYCENITEAFANMRAREDLVDELYASELAWLRDDSENIRCGRFTDVMLARRRFLFVPGNERLGQLVAGSIEGALRQLKGAERKIDRRWKQTREAVADAWDIEADSCLELLIDSSNVPPAVIQNTGLSLPIPTFETPRFRVSLSFVELAQTLRKW